MSLHIRWARALGLATGSVFLLVGAMPAVASAHAGHSACAAGRHACAGHRANRHDQGNRLTKAKAKASQAQGRTLIFGSGDTQDGGLGISPSEPITDLQNILTQAGFGVDVSANLPGNLNQYDAIWSVDDNPLTSTEQSELEAFVDAGHGVYLTGDHPATVSPDASDTSVIDALVAGGAVTAGGQGDADAPASPNAVNASLPDELSIVPNQLTAWTPRQPGGMSGVDASNIVSSTAFTGVATPTGAAWDGSDMAGGHGRLAILMDINWLESEFWDQPTAVQMAVNLERFLLSTLPVATASNGSWSGYAAKAKGVRDVTGAWTVPTVDCSKAAKPSAAGIWVGIDGYGNNKLVKAGVGITCSTPTSVPCFYLFTEVLPSVETPTTACSVSPGDHVSVDVRNSPFGSSTFVATMTDTDASINQTTDLTAPTKRDKSAECVVQLPSGKVGSTPTRYKQLADFGTVSFSNCSATATENAGDTLDTEPLVLGSDGAFAVKGLNMGTAKHPLATVGTPAWPDLGWTVTWVSAKGT
jgi:hypothetical protein